MKFMKAPIYYMKATGLSLVLGCPDWPNEFNFEDQFLNAFLWGHGRATAIVGIHSGTPALCRA